MGRFVAFPSQDLQANSDINFNSTKLGKATADFTGANNVNDTVRRLLSNGTEKLTGNKGFWASDYMVRIQVAKKKAKLTIQVHRRKSFVLANKMLSTRSLNTETVNGANPLGGHLGQGSMFTYVDGTEYRDIMGAWDWNLVPGTTTLLNQPVLSSKNTNLAGKTSFVGVVSDGDVGTAVMDYVDPATGQLSYRKAWFFIDDYVLVSTAAIKNTATAPVVSVLDNRASTGDTIYVDGRQARGSGSGSVAGKTLFYGRNGYLSHDKFNLTLSDGQRTGNWSAISTSTVGETTVAIFSAYDTVAKSSSAYTVFPASSRSRLDKEARSPTTKPITQEGVSGAVGNGRLSVVFWPGGPKSTTVLLRDIGWAAIGYVTVTAQQPGAYLLSSDPVWGHSKTVAVTAADPTQNLTSTSVTLKTSLLKGGGWLGGILPGSETSASFTLPTAGMAGSSVSKKVSLKVPLV